MFASVFCQFDASSLVDYLVAARLLAHRMFAQQALPLVFFIG